MRNQQQVGKKQKSRKLYIFFLILVLLCVTGAGLSFLGYEMYTTSYHRDLSLAQVGMQHLRTAETLLEVLPKTPFDIQRVNQAQHEFTAATTAFGQVNNDLKSLPSISTSIPIYSVRLRAALHLLPIAIELSQTGVTGCNLLSLIISRFHDPLNTHTQGLTMADFSVIEKDFHEVKTTLSLVVDQVNHLQPADLQVDPRLGKYFTAFQRDIPQLQTWLVIVEKLLPVAPTLLGIGTPANYLIEVLDSTELRPGGGFIGNYGIATLSGGRLTAAHITDTYLLDRAFTAAGHSIPYPSAYTWFDIGGSSWNLRDSNLDADFPTAARYAELNYAREGGKIPVQGVIAITPGFIQHALEITGPIAVPEYHETVTAKNLIDRIHYYQVGGGYEGGDIPSPDNKSSVRKHFTALLADHFLAHVRQLSSSALPKFLQLVLSSQHSKDIQVYLNLSSAENLLQSYHLVATIQSPPGDSLLVVDANISPNKANQFITNTLDDQVTIDPEGSAIHHTTISYAWGADGPIYGLPLYRDYVRVYVPPGSLLHAQDGWQPEGTSRAFSREVWAGFITLSHGQTRTITLIWTIPGVARQVGHDWHYQYLIQRQAGIQWKLHWRITLPSCAVMIGKSGGLVSSNKQVVTFAQSLKEDMSLGIDYVCR